MNINATLINYFHICQRKMWLHANGITMEHTSDVVSEGKLIGEESYPQRAEKNQELAVSLDLEDGTVASAKIDFFDAIRGVVHETKKSAAKEKAHVAQVKFYLYLLRKNGIRAAYGIIEYPKLRQSEKVELLDEEMAEVERWIQSATEIIQCENCPPTLPISKCKSCSYFDFCWAGEAD
jgi:CRISPR-associated exonuclease Cas4